jgi:ubiquinone/menaquinone biosynthesis C-methylase UbiE
MIDAMEPDQLKALVAGVFSRSAGTYERTGVNFFDGIGARLVAFAELRAGERVLDVGCGRGAVLFPAAAAVGPSGRVLGIDLAAGMVELTGRDITARGLAHAEVQVADAELPPGPPGSFDAVLASLVLFFLPGLPDALRRYAELLAPGGRLAFTSFARDDERWAPVNELLESYAPEERRRPKADPAEVGPFDSPAVMAELLRAAQFTAVRHEDVELVTEIPDADHWWAWSWSHGRRAALEAIDEAELPEARARAVELMEHLREPGGGYTIRQEIRYTLATTAA